MQFQRKPVHQLGAWVSLPMAAARRGHYHIVLPTANVQNICALGVVWVLTAARLKYTHSYRHYGGSDRGEGVSLRHLLSALGARCEYVPPQSDMHSCVVSRMIVASVLCCWVSLLVFLFSLVLSALASSAISRKARA